MFSNSCSFVFTIKFPYNARSGWLKQLALSEIRASLNSRGKLTVWLSAIELSAWLLNMIRTNTECFFLDAKHPVSFPLETSCEWTSRKSHDATQKNVLTWCILIYHVIGGIKNVTPKAAKNSWRRGLLGRVIMRWRVSSYMWGINEMKGV